jgi:hypothetical protein
MHILEVVTTLEIEEERRDLREKVVFYGITVKKYGHFMQTRKMQVKMMPNLARQDDDEVLLMVSGAEEVSLVIVIFRYWMFHSHDWKESLVCEDHQHI